MNREAVLEDAVLIALRRIIRAVDLRSRSLMLDIGLTVPQLAALQAVGRGQPMTAGEVAREIHVGQPTVTGILDRLERRRLIQRLRGTQDRRQVNVVLTPEGQQVLQGAPSGAAGPFPSQSGSVGRLGTDPDTGDVAAHRGDDGVSCDGGGAAHRGRVVRSGEVVSGFAGAARVR